MLAGRMGSIVERHNALHSLMGRLSQAAGILNISPRLQENSATIESVRVAFDTLGQASRASAVTLAVDLILQFANDNSGADAANKLLKQYPKQNYPALPDALWTEVSIIAAMLNLRRRRSRRRRCRR